MPLYEYECDACGQRFELIRKFSDPPVEICALCGKGPVQRVPSSPAIQFKGSGWYITDYAQKGKGGKSETSAGEKSAGGKAGSESGTDAGAKTGTEGTAAKSETATKPAASSGRTDGGSKD